MHSEIAGNTANRLNEAASKKNNYSGSIGLTFYRNEKKNVRSVLGLRYSFALSNAIDGNNGLTSTQDTNYAVRYQNKLATLNNTAGVNYSLEFKVSDRNLISASFENENRFINSDQQKNLYSSATNDYTINDPQYSNFVGYALSKNGLTVKDNYNFKDNKTNVEFGSVLQHTYIYAASTVSKNYIGVNPFVNLSIKYSNLKELRMSLEKRSEMPDFNQLNPMFNTSTAYLYTMGNLNLQPADRYSFNVSFKTQVFRVGNFFNTYLGLIYIEKNIVETTLIPVQSDISMGGKIIPIGSLLTSYQNINDYRYLYYGVSYDMPVPFIKTVWKFKTNFQARSSNTLINDFRVNTTSYDYIVSSSFSSIISTKIDFSLFMAYNYNRSIQTNKSVLVRNLDQYKLNALITAQLDKRQSIKLESNLNAINGLTENDTRFYLVDLSYQVKALRDKKLMLTITLHDLLNSYRNYSYEYQYNSAFGNSANTVYSSYSNNVGRYLLFLVSYNL